MSRNWPALPPLPGPNIPLIDLTTGAITRVWYQYLTVLDPIARGVVGLTLNDISNIDAEAPADGDVLTWVDADAKWKGA